MNGKKMMVKKDKVIIIYQIMKEIVIQNLIFLQNIKKFHIMKKKNSKKAKIVSLRKD